MLNLYVKIQILIALVVSATATATHNSNNQRVRRLYLYVILHDVLHSRQRYTVMTFHHNGRYVSQAGSSEQFSISFTQQYLITLKEIYHTFSTTK